ncbi:hypothetical protein B0J12DRAFT_667539 [Macrophomina phaseolina]|uniref:Uncharacterized protein n=1 Tax=Macrophomina phaseolina TaxID=35725 RepID=A0ABQ8GB46_9PEZI|nr:hypothetical protein B0J12DRAFT_667539 [Macrophomina phaseolina]
MATPATPATSAATATPATPTKKPKRHKSRDLTRDERLQCLTLRSVGGEYQKIAQKLGCTARQVQHACEAGHPTPSKRTGRRLKLKPHQIDELEAFICSSIENRLLSYSALAYRPFRHFDVSEGAIKNALESHGYGRYVARAKPPLSKKNQREKNPPGAQALALEKGAMVSNTLDGRDLGTRPPLPETTDYTESRGEVYSA